MYDPSCIEHAWRDVSGPSSAHYRATNTISLYAQIACTKTTRIARCYTRSSGVLWRLVDTTPTGLSLIASPPSMSTCTRHALANMEAGPADTCPSSAKWRPGTPGLSALRACTANANSQQLVSALAKLPPGDLTKQVKFSIRARSRILVTTCSQPAIMQKPSVSPPRGCCCSHGTPALRIYVVSTLLP